MLRVALRVCVVLSAFAAVFVAGAQVGVRRLTEIPVRSAETKDATTQPASAPALQPAGAPAQAETAIPVPELIAQLGAADFRDREKATSALISRGPAVRVAVEAALAGATDPEVRRRLDYLLTLIVPQQWGVLVIRVAPDCKLRPGCLITHVADREVPELREFERQVAETTGPVDVQYVGEHGVLNVRLDDLREIETVSNYRSGRS